MSLQIGMADGGADQEAFFQKQKSISAKVAAKCSLRHSLCS